MILKMRWYSTKGLTKAKMVGAHPLLREPRIQRVLFWGCYLPHCTSSCCQPPVLEKPRANRAAGRGGTGKERRSYSAATNQGSALFALANQ